MLSSNIFQFVLLSVQFACGVLLRALRLHLEASDGLFEHLDLSSQLVQLFLLIGRLLLQLVLVTAKSDELK